MPNLILRSPPKVKRSGSLVCPEYGLSGTCPIAKECGLNNVADICPFMHEGFKQKGYATFSGICRVFDRDMSYARKGLSEACFGEIVSNDKEAENILKKIQKLSKRKERN